MGRWCIADRTVAAALCPERSRCSNGSAQLAGGLCCSPTAATCRRRRSPAACEDGLPIDEDEVLTPVESAITYLRRNHARQPVLLFATPSIHARIADQGIPLTSDADAEVVLVTHVDQIDLDALERGARAVAAGAPLLTGSYARGYAGTNGLVFSRGAMVTAAIAKVTGARPKVVGKPSRAAVGELRTHFGVPPSELAVIGDDLTVDVRLGRMGGSLTALVRSGTSGAIELARVPKHQRPDAVIDSVADLLEWL